MVSQHISKRDNQLSQNSKQPTPIQQNLSKAFDSNLFVKNVPVEIDEEAFKHVFENFGKDNRNQSIPLKAGECSAAAEGTSMDDTLLISSAKNFPQRQQVITMPEATACWEAASVGTQTLNFTLEYTTNVEKVTLDLSKLLGTCKGTVKADNAATVEFSCKEGVNNIDFNANNCSSITITLDAGA